MTRANDMAEIAEAIADDDTHGYSQRPPSGRWGPDFDCSSLMYYIANKAGYSVGAGQDRARVTSTMLKDFKDAGFQILPFANVGLGDLEIGDILLNLALHAEVYVGEGQVVGAQSSETGGFVGEAGDQTGEEIVKQPAYIFDKGWDYVLRPPAEEEADEEGEQNMPTNYPTPNYGGWQGRTQMPNYYGTYGMPQTGYPQGNLGQMNGYAQANAGYPQQNGYSQSNGYSTQQRMYPQGNGQNSNGLIWVNGGVEGAKEYPVDPGCTVALFDTNGMYVYIKSADQEGFPNIRVFELHETDNIGPQHHHGMMGQMGEDQFVTRQEFEQLREMFQNGQQFSAATGAMGDLGNGQQPNSSTNSSNGRSNGRQSNTGSGGPNGRNS